MMFRVTSDELQGRAGHAPTDSAEFSGVGHTS
jgi:hypothetical protein